MPRRRRGSSARSLGQTLPRRMRRRLRTWRTALRSRRQPSRADSSSPRHRHRHRRSVRQRPLPLPRLRAVQRPEEGLPHKSRPSAPPDSRADRRVADAALPVTATCPYCTTPVDMANAWECDACHTAHHGECWIENQGCAVAACSSGPSATDPSLRPFVPPRGTVIDLSEPDTALVTPADGAPGSAVSRRRAQRRAQIIVALIASCFLVAVVVLVVTAPQ